jgi:hypothetical protein
MGHGAGSGEVRCSTSPAQEFAALASVFRRRLVVGASTAAAAAVGANFGGVACPPSSAARSGSTCSTPSADSPDASTQTTDSVILLPLCQPLSCLLSFPLLPLVCPAFAAPPSRTSTDHLRLFAFGEVDDYAQLCY